MHQARSIRQKCGATPLFSFRRSEAQLCRQCAEAAIALSTEHGFPHYLAWGTILRGWAMAELEGSNEGIALIHQGFATYQATGAKLAVAFHLALLASAYGNAGQVSKGLSLLAEALARVDETGERQYEAEMHRLAGELILQGSSAGIGESANAEKEAEACFCKAITVARQQAARSLELRSVLSLAQLWQRQGKSAQARQRLKEIRGTFTEGFETADLRQTDAMLTVR